MPARRCLPFRFLLMAAMWPGSIFAQPAPPVALQVLVGSPAYQANISRLFSDFPPEVFQRCGTLVSRGSTVTVLKPVSFASDGYPISGAWAQSFPVSGCGNDTVFHFFFVAQANEKILSIVGAPGETHADWTLQKDAARYVMIATHAKAPTCASPQVKATTYDGVVGDPSQTAKPAWHETWVVAACGQIMRVGIKFIPDATGTVIATEPVKLGM